MVVVRVLACWSEPVPLLFDEVRQHRVWFPELRVQLEVGFAHSAEPHSGWLFTRLYSPPPPEATESNLSEVLEKLSVLPTFSSWLKLGGTAAQRLSPALEAG